MAVGTLEVLFSPKRRKLKESEDVFKNLPSQTQLLAPVRKIKRFRKNSFLFTSTHSRYVEHIQRFNILETSEIGETVLSVDRTPQRTNQIMGNFLV